MVVLQLPLGQLVRSREVDSGGQGDLAQHLVGEEGPADHGQVIGRGIMILVRQAVRVDEMGVQAAQLPGPLIHDVREDLPVRGARDVLRHRIAHLIGGADQDGVQALLHGQFLPHVHGDVAAVPGRVEDSIVGKCHDLIHLAALRGNQGGEDLGGAGGVFPLVDIFGVKDGASLELHQNGGLRPHHRASGPVGHLVGLDGQGAVGCKKQLRGGRGLGLHREGRGQGQTAGAEDGSEKPDIFMEKFSGHLSTSHLFIHI